MSESKRTTDDVIEEMNREHVTKRSMEEDAHRKSVDLVREVCDAGLVDDVQPSARSKHDAATIAGVDTSHPLQCTPPMLLRLAAIALDTASQGRSIGLTYGEMRQLIDASTDAVVYVGDTNNAVLRRMEMPTDDHNRESLWHFHRLMLALSLEHRVTWEDGTSEVFCVERPKG